MELIPIAFLFVIAAVLLVSGFFWFRKYTGLSADKGYLALLATVIAAGVQIFVRTQNQPRMFGHSNRDWAIVSMIAAGACIVFGAAFALRLWGKWIGGKATVEESQPGQPGVQAWFCMSNVIVGLALVICAWAGHNISPLLTVVAVGAALAAYPLLRMESPAPAISAVPDHSSGEREKIVALLEAGKITADECAELLQALGETTHAPSRQAPLTSGQRLLLIGAALVALGFFLPWIVINPGHEAGRMMSQFGMTTGLEMPGGGVSLPNPQIQTPTVSYAGGDIQRGLGWAALALALAAALIPYVATTLDAATSRTVRLLCLGVGGIIVLHLLTQNIRFVGIGLMIAVSGYALEIAGALRERKMAGQ
ncbi:MAG: hypothetical protein ABIZ56_13390 [Chthoniobacteraceae bacterium]